VRDFTRLFASLGCVQSTHPTFAQGPGATDTAGLAPTLIVANCFGKPLVNA
jgi:hypothetical protein